MRRLWIAALALAFAVPAAAQQGSLARPAGDAMLGIVFGQDVPSAATDKAMPPARARQAVIEFLRLTPDQVAAWDELAETAKAQAEPIRQEIGANDEALRQLLQGGGADPAKVGGLVIDNHDAYRQLGEIHRAYVDGFEGLLDDEQLRRLGAIRHAARLEPLLPAFRLLGLLAPR